LIEAIIGGSQKAERRKGVMRFSATMLLALMIVTLACASTEPGKPAVAYITEHGKLERGVAVSRGQVLKYSFDSMDQVMFTISLSQRGKTIPPATRLRTNSARGKVDSGVGVECCFKWENQMGRQVRVTYHLEFVEKE
jgi:hypothetical protein